MSWTFMQSFSFIPLMASEKKIFEYLFQKSKSAIWTKFVWLVEDYSRNVSVKLFQNIYNNTEINAYFTFPIISNESPWAMTIKNKLRRG